MKKAARLSAMPGVEDVVVPTALVIIPIKYPYPATNNMKVQKTKVGKKLEISACRSK